MTFPLLSAVIEALDGLPPGKEHCSVLAVKGLQLALQNAVLRHLFKRAGIVDSGEAKVHGIGAMSAARIRDFHDQMVRAGLYKPGEVDLSKVATLQFVNKKVGQDLKATLGAK